MEAVSQKLFLALKHRFLEENIKDTPLPNLFGSLGLPLVQKDIIMHFNQKHK